MPLRPLRQKTQPVEILRERAQQFNRSYPVGTTIEYCERRGGPRVITTTYSEAFVAQGMNTVMIRIVDAFPGGRAVLLDFVTPIRKRTA